MINKKGRAVKPAFATKIILLVFVVLLGGCSEADSGVNNTGTIVEGSDAIRSVYLRDKNGERGTISGSLIIKMQDQLAARIDKGDEPYKVNLYWLSPEGAIIGQPWLSVDSSPGTPAFSFDQESKRYQLAIADVLLSTAQLNEQQHKLLLQIVFAADGKPIEKMITLHDFSGNVLLSGPGGNYLTSWYYGTDRDKISVHRNLAGECVFDNGLVSVIDMNNQEDELWQGSIDDQDPNTANDKAFPAYRFACDKNPINTYRKIEDEDGVWTYSTLNDAMFYGTLVYDAFLKYLAEPALEEKLRVRVHYGPVANTSGTWDGAYADFGDGYLSQYSAASLDSIAHEIGHGVLSRISDLNGFKRPLSDDARTIHEAFGDISGVMAAYQFTGQENNWIHGAENDGRLRKLNQIKTESGAIANFFEYDKAGKNFYQRIGMMTYPFYVLSQKWGLEPAFLLYIEAAKNCWQADTNLTQAALCLKQQAKAQGMSEQDVVTAFKTVKIKLFEHGVLSSFNVDKFKLRVEFNDDSRSTSQTNSWLWQFGDGQSSTQQHPEHIYAAKGDYQVTLTVKDQSADEDSFVRDISVTDEYCPHIGQNVNNTITAVQFAGVDINFSADRSDYTDQIITINDASNVRVVVAGDTQMMARSNRWKVWLDANDDGIFSNDEDELLVDVYHAQGQPYELDAQFDLSHLPQDGSAKYLRVIGDYALNKACISSVGEVFDLKVVW